ncbi:SWEET family sugar transporter [Micromonospora sp. CPCC 205371]|nr:SWEET family sugar transporter [Micromonospora sp. CPCC 205371]
MRIHRGAVALRVHWHAVAFALPTRSPGRRGSPGRAPHLRGDRTLVTLLGIAAATWGLVMATAPILQIRRMILRRSSSDLSLGYFGVLLPGFVLWIGYGWTRADWALVIPNILALTVGVVTVVVALSLRRRAPEDRDQALTAARR